MRAPFFRCSGGDLMAGASRLGLTDALALQEVYGEEISAASIAADGAALARALRQARDLQRALTAWALWRRANSSAGARR